MDILSNEPELTDSMQDNEITCPVCNNSDPDEIGVVRMVGGRRGHEWWCGIVKCLKCSKVFAITAKSPCNCRLSERAPEQTREITT
jgi:hypothetical protein